MTGRARGEAGERAAEQYLEKLGARILRRNYSCRGGEIDLIALDDETLLFVEVKLRSNERYGTPGEAVNCAKRRRICRAALTYLHEIGEVEVPMRFDVIEVTPDGVNHLPGAFDYVE